MTAQDYDSRPDTEKHIARVRELLEMAAAELRHRGEIHDASKLEFPEKQVFDEFTPLLKTSTYGGPEYVGFLAGMSEGLKHHYACNAHHPEHHGDGISGMSLFDLLEMLLDWKAAGERHADGDILRSLEINRERFEISPQLMQILENTARQYLIPAPAVEVPK